MGVLWGWGEEGGEMPGPARELTVHRPAVHFKVGGRPSAAAPDSRTFAPGDTVSAGCSSLYAWQTPLCLAFPE